MNRMESSIFRGDSMKKIVTILCALLILAPSHAFALSVSATSAVLMDAETGQILYEKNPDTKMRIASTTKIMTALVVLEHCGLQESVTILPEHMVEGSSMYLKPGEMVTVESLLYGLLLCSGNDAALALADHSAGSVERFVGWMNEKARTLGMNGTSFANPNGLDAENHYSTARDMALLATYAAENPTFVRICSTMTASVGDRNMSNHNKLLHRLDGCIGMKTGYTMAAGRTLVSCVQRSGGRLVAVTLQDGNDWVDHAAMYEEGFAALQSDTTAFLAQEGRLG